jgi:hypothetical protein
MPSGMRGDLSFHPRLHPVETQRFLDSPRPAFIIGARLVASKRILSIFL